MHDNMCIPMPFLGEIDLYELPHPAGYLYQREQLMLQYIADLEDMLNEAMAEGQRQLGYLPDMDIDAKAVASLLSLGRGRVLREMFEGLQTLSFDLKNRMDTELKGAVTAKLTATLDDDANRVLVSSKVKVDTAPAESGGCLFIATDGTVIPSKEAFEQLPLLKDDMDKAA